MHEGRDMRVGVWLVLGRRHLMALNVVMFKGCFPRTALAWHCLSEAATSCVMRCLATVHALQKEHPDCQLDRLVLASPDLPEFASLCL